MLDAFLADGGRFEETADVTDEEAGIARDDPVTSAHAPTLAYPNLSLALARTLHQEYGGGSSEVEAPEEAAARAELEEALLCGASPLPRTRTDGAVAALRDEGVVRLGGALSVATAAALRVHILAQLNAALAEEEEDVEADGADCEVADGDAAGDAAVQAMLGAFLADGGSFEEIGGVEGGVEDGGALEGGAGGGGARGGRGARTDRFSSVLAPRGETEEARWDLRLELTPPVRRSAHSTRAQPSTLSLAPPPRLTTAHYQHTTSTTTTKRHHRRSTPACHASAPPPPRPSAPPSHALGATPPPSLCPGARGPSRARARRHGRGPRGERGRWRAPLRAGRPRLGAWRAGAANARGHALVRGRLPLHRVRRAAARKVRDGPGALTNAPLSVPTTLLTPTHPSSGPTTHVPYATHAPTQPRDGPDALAARVALRCGAARIRRRGAANRRLHTRTRGRRGMRAARHRRGAPHSHSCRAWHVHVHAPAGKLLLNFTPVSLRR